MYPKVTSKDAVVCVISGCMYAGKTEELIRRMRRYPFGRKNSVLFKHISDTRYSNEGKVVSHMRNERDAIPTSNPTHILHYVLEHKQEIHAVGIDEGQFFSSDIVKVCQTLADNGVDVIVAGLASDFRGEPFGPMPELLAIATELVLVKAVCVVCGNDATRTQRVIDGVSASWDDPIVLVGAEEKYEARCRACHEVRNKPVFEVSY